MLRLRGVRSIVKPPGVDEKDEGCPDRLLLLAQELEENEQGEGEEAAAAVVALEGT